jgi:HNH endonuclease
MSRVPASLATKVRARAVNRCEYCRLPSIASQAVFEVEHIIPLKHGGRTVLENLALACMHCNRHKGVNIGGIPAAEGRLVRLFHPRRDEWGRHFRIRDGMLTGRTLIGQVTLQVLAMNNPAQIQLRKLWFAHLPP